MCMRVCARGRRGGESDSYKTKHALKGAQIYEVCMYVEGQDLCADASNESCHVMDLSSTEGECATV
jgi:hypothetical protein